MTPRVALILTLALIPVTAHAGFWENYNKIQGHVAQRVVVSGAIRGITVTNRHGRSVPVAVPPAAQLGDTLALPPGDWAEMTLTLDGPLLVTVDGAAPVSLALDTLTVALEDPEARTVVLDWVLPDAVLAGLRAGAPDRALIVALQDGGSARPSR